MDHILSVLRGLNEYQTLLQMTQKGKTAGVSGLSQLCRTHVLAALIRTVAAPWYW